jgi:hypothetical protein
VDFFCVVFPGRRRSGFGIMCGFRGQSLLSRGRCPRSFVKKKNKKNFKINKIKLGGMELMLYLCVNKKGK